MKLICFLFLPFLLLGCFATQKQDVSQEELAARIEAVRKSDSLINYSKDVMETRNLAQAISGVHTHGIMGSGNLAFDAHQDP